MSSHKATITVFLSSGGGVPRIFKDATIELGHLLAGRGYGLCYGGLGIGNMGLLANAAMKEGGTVTGVIPVAIREKEVVHKGLSRLVEVENIWERKQKMFWMADDFIVLPGGYGTLDEMLEVLYWGSLGRHKKRVVLVNTDGYWDSLVRFLDKSLQAGLFPESANRLLHVVSDASEALDVLSQKKTEDSVLNTNAHLPHFEDEIRQPITDPILILKPDLEQMYRLSVALLLRQLSEHNRTIGALNTNGQLDDLLAWIERARQDRFITPECPSLLIVRNTPHDLREAVASAAPVTIDVGQKWYAESA